MMEVKEKSMGCLAFGRRYQCGPRSCGTSMAFHSSWPPLFGQTGTWLAWVAKKKWINMWLHSTIYRGKWPCLPATGPDENPVARELFNSHYSVPGWATLHGLNLASYSMENIYGEPQKGFYDTLMGSQQGSWSIHGLPKKAHGWKGVLKICVASMGSQNGLKKFAQLQKKFLSSEIDIGFKQV